MPEKDIYYKTILETYELCPNRNVSIFIDEDALPSN
jgi:hypothetical protein